jgi:hypothetical protein
MTRISCLCGINAFEIRGTIHNARYCHCGNCRKFSGAGYAAWGIVSTDHLELTSSDLNVTKYDSGGGLRVFCNSCGSPLWFEPADFPAIRGIPLGVIDDPEIAAPGMHVWTKSKVPWVSLPDDAEQHETHP